MKWDKAIGIAVVAMLIVGVAAAKIALENGRSGAGKSGIVERGYRAQQSDGDSDIMQKLEQLKDKLGRLEPKIDEVDEKVSTVIQRIDGLEEKLDDWDDYDDEWEDDYYDEEWDEYYDDYDEDYYDDWDEDYDWDSDYEDVITLAIYEVDNGDIELIEKPEVSDSRERELQEDSEKHQMVWDRFTILIPEEHVAYVSEFHVYTDGRDGELAAVEAESEDLENWILMIDLEDAFRNDKIDEKELTHTLIHEFSHILTLNDGQIDGVNTEFLSDREYERLEEECSPNFFTWEGCTKDNSYLNQFFDEFWSDIYGEWVRIDEIEDDDRYYDALDRFFDKYDGQFQGDYDLVDPVEDIAESFTFFVVEGKPDGSSVAEQKVLFFYQFPELVELRNEIREGI